VEDLIPVQVVGEDLIPVQVAGEDLIPVQVAGEASSLVPQVVATTLPLVVEVAVVVGSTRLPLRGAGGPDQLIHTMVVPLTGELHD